MVVTKSLELMFTWYPGYHDNAVAFGFFVFFLENVALNV